MKFGFLVVLFSFQLFAQDKLSIPDISKLDPNKYTVCTMTLNSSDEKEMFKKRLPKNQFQFVELTDFAADADPKSTTADEFLNNACESGLHCHMLIVSGHFGGTFFGSSGKSASASTLEKKSCEKSCAGILNTPREVFLFGCNTLAGKEKDSRTPEEYLEVLLNDQQYMNVDRATLESIVEARYGSFGTEFKDIMTRTFEGVPNIYGFNSVGPSGKNVKGLLGNYFNKIGDYGAYYKKKFGPPSKGNPKDAAVLSKLAHQLKELEKKNFFNPELKEALKITSFTQCQGLMPSDPAMPVKKKICQLYDGSISKVDRMKLINELMHDEKKLAFFPMIADVLLQNYDLVDLKENDCEECKIFQSLIADEKTKKELLSAIKAVNVVALKARWLELARAVGWMEEGDFNAESRKIIIALVKEPLTRSNIDTLMSLDDSIKEASGITPNDLFPNMTQSELGIEVIDKLMDTSAKLMPYKESILSQYMSFKGDPKGDYFTALNSLMERLMKDGALLEERSFVNWLLSEEKSILSYASSSKDDELMLSKLELYRTLIVMSAAKNKDQIVRFLNQHPHQFSYLMAKIFYLPSQMKMEAIKTIEENFNRFSEESQLRMLDTIDKSYLLDDTFKDITLKNFLSSEGDDALKWSCVIAKTNFLSLTHEMREKLFSLYSNLNKKTLTTKPGDKALTQWDSGAISSMKNFWEHTFSGDQVFEEKCDYALKFIEAGMGEISRPYLNQCASHFPSFKEKLKTDKKAD